MNQPPVLLGGGSEEFQGQVVWVTEGEAGSVGSIDDVAVRDPEVVKALLP